MRFFQKNIWLSFFFCLGFSFVFCVAQSIAMMGTETVWICVVNQTFVEFWLFISTVSGLFCLALITQLVDDNYKIKLGPALFTSLLASLASLVMNWLLVTAFTEI